MESDQEKKLGCYMQHGLDSDKNQSRYGWKLSEHFASLFNNDD